MRPIDRIEQLTNALMCYVAAPCFVYLVVVALLAHFGVIEL